MQIACRVKRPQRRQRGYGESSDRDGFVVWKWNLGVRSRRKGGHLKRTLTEEQANKVGAPKSSPQGRSTRKDTATVSAREK